MTLFLRPTPRPSAFKAAFFGVSRVLRAIVSGFEWSETVTGRSGCLGFRVSSIELNLVVNAEGGIELLGKVSTGIEASMKITLTRSGER